ncbi:hypothetical protein JTI58_12135 [Lysinibacillus fusiformis]|uniref:hypothetical protein n=1 Tax=Lysinibacillus fusiformis TaxID=28031 RepID=UPI001967A869|nr:hypothetical protein [Lysinibacillus fusiformis]QSB12306.1 hypothetical protein JTI58_12135 [Lysinibacillus fusiformis]
MKENKQIRHRKIKEILKTYDRLTQDGIRQILAEEYSIEVDRSIISKDLKELKIHRNKEKMTLELSQESKQRDLQIQIYNLLSSTGIESNYFHNGLDDGKVNTKEAQEKLNLTFEIFYTEPQIAVAVAVLLEQLFENRYDPFVAFANHSGKILLTFSERDQVNITAELNQILDGHFV